MRFSRFGLVGLCTLCALCTVAGAAGAVGAVGARAMTEQDILRGAKARIERYRKADAVVRVVDRKGRPVPGASVRVEQVRHAFLFGCNAFALFDYPDPAREAVYERRFTDLFNYATLGVYWGAYEPRPDRTTESDAMLVRRARWLADRGVRVKGHPLVWHEVYPAWAPNDPDAARERLRARVTALVRDHRGLIDTWDVVNEATVSSRFDNGVGRWIKRDGAEAVVSEALRWARAANPKAFLLYNDYNLGPDYEALAKTLVESKAPFDALGLQSHMHTGEWTIPRAWQVCETYAKFGKPLHFTETTVVSGEHGFNRPLPWPTTPEGEARQAEYVAKLYTVLFSHPAVEAITWWDLQDGAWMGAPGGLLRADLSQKPAYERLLRLVRHDWWTSIDRTTAKDGTARFRGFCGKYRISVKTPGGTATKALDVRRGARNALVVKLP